MLFIIDESHKILLKEQLAIPHEGGFAAFTIAAAAVTPDVISSKT